MVYLWPAGPYHHGSSELRITHEYAERLAEIREAFGVSCSGSIAANGQYYFTVNGMIMPSRKWGAPVLVSGTKQMAK